MHPIIKPLGILLIITLLLSGLTNVSTNSPGLVPDPSDDSHESTYSEWEDAFVISKDKGISMSKSGGRGGTNGGSDPEDDPKLSIDIEKYTNGYDSDASPGLEIIIGSTVEWRYNVTNTGDLPLKNIVVSDNDSSVNPIYMNGDDNENELLDLGEVWVYNASGTAEAGQYSNIGKVTAYHGTTIVTDEDTSHYVGISEPVFVAAHSIDIEKFTNGEDSDVYGSEIPVGSPVEWTYVVNNTGNVTLTNVIVTDDQGVTPIYQSGDTHDDGVLEPGEVWTYNNSSFAVEGPYVNIGNVTAQYLTTVVTDEDSSHYVGVSEPVFVPAPSIDIEKFTNGEDSDVSGSEIAVGSPVEWIYVVNNTGNVNLTEVIVTDDQGVTPIYQRGDTNDDGVLEPGEVWTYNNSSFAVEGPYVNIGNVTAQYLTTVVTDEDSSHYVGVSEPVFVPAPSIDIEKFTNGEDSDVSGSEIAVGSSVEWTYNVTNTGNVNLTEVIVTDDQGVTPIYQSGDTHDDGVLEPGEVWTYNNSSFAVEGPYVNIGNVTAQYITTVVTDEDLSHYFGVNASIDLEKFTDYHDADEPIGPYLLVGYPVEWTYNVTNTGNVNLDIDVQDNDSSVTPVYMSGDDGDDLFEPGEVWVFNASGTVVLGQYCNVGNVTASYGYFLATDEDSSYYFGITTEEFKGMVGGKGYWKKEQNWPEDVTNVTIGNVTYTKAEAISYLNSPVQDKPYIMFGQLLPAKLNVMVGAPYYPHVIDGELVYFIEVADVWMEDYPLDGSGSGVDAAWNESGEQLKDVLEMYNEGTLYT